MRARAEAFGLLTEEVDGQDVLAVQAAARRLIERARRGEGPAFLLCHTYRYLGHHVGDVSREYYRPKAEEAEWRTQRDPLQRLAGWLIGQQLADAGLIQHLEAQVSAEVAAAVDYALAAPFPEPGEVRQHVYA
jgi:pyruvate dehydrogenase E1 component alpha subunit